MAKSTTYTVVSGNSMNTAANWSTGLPVAGDTATINGSVTAGTLPAGVTCTTTASGAIGGGTFLSVVDNSAGGSITAGNFRMGIVFTGGTTYGIANRPTNIIPIMCMN